MTKHNREHGQMILDTIDDYSREYGYAPNVREIGERVGLASPSATYFWLEKLETDGRLRREPGVARSYRVVRHAVPPGTCHRPGCGRPLTGRRTVFCSRTCDTIAAHVRRWLRAVGREHLAEDIGLPMNARSVYASLTASEAEPNRLRVAAAANQLTPGGGRRAASGSETDA